MPTFQQFLLPDAGEGLTEAEIVAWHVAVGDRVAVNQMLVEIETAKSVVDLPSPYAGLVTALHVDAGATVPVGAPIVTIDTDPDGVTSGTGPAEVVADASEVVTATRGREPEVTTSRGGHDPAAGTVGDPVLVGYGVVGAPTRRRARTADGAAPATTTPPAPAAVAPAAAEPPVLAKPPVRKLAKDLGVDLAGVSATGPGGIVTREDVLAHAEAAQPRTLATYPGDDAPWLASGSVSADGRQTRVPVRSVRKRTAEAMVTSAFTAPHVTVFHTLDVTRTMRLVAQLKEDKEFAGVHVTPLLVAARALLMAVRRHPEINASWDERSQEIVYKHYVNLGVAAATPRGLVVPNIKDAHRMGLHDLAVALGELTTAARAGRTTPADMADGTITITNVGVFGIDTGTPILNPGEAAILAFGAVRRQPWVHKDKVKPRWVTQLALSFDHRLVDGELGSRVLADVAALLGDPAKALVWG